MSTEDRAFETFDVDQRPEEALAGANDIMDTILPGWSNTLAKGKEMTDDLYAKQRAIENLAAALTESYEAGLISDEHLALLNDTETPSQEKLAASEDPTTHDLHVKRGEIFITDNESVEVILPWLVYIGGEKHDVVAVVATGADFDVQHFQVSLRARPSEQQDGEVSIELAQLLADVDIRDWENEINEVAEAD